MRFFALIVALVLSLALFVSAEGSQTSLKEQIQASLASKTNAQIKDANEVGTSEPSESTPLPSTSDAQVVSGLVGSAMAVVMFFA